MCGAIDPNIDNFIIPLGMHNREELKSTDGDLRDSEWEALQNPSTEWNMASRGSGCTRKPPAVGALFGGGDKILPMFEELHNRTDCSLRLLLKAALRSGQATDI